MQRCKELNTFNCVNGIGCAVMEKCCEFPNEKSSSMRSSLTPPHVTNNRVNAKGARPEIYQHHTTA